MHKRLFLICISTAGSLGMVLAITPPQLNSGKIFKGVPNSPLNSLTPSTNPIATKAPEPTKSTRSTKIPAPVTKSPTPKGISGTFTGGLANTAYGPVQVQITVLNNKITNAIGLVYPMGSSRDQQINQQAVPYLIKETLSAQSSNIQGVGGASYTSQGWVDSLQSAIVKAKL